MELPTPSRAVIALADFVRERLVGTALAPLRSLRDESSEHRATPVIVGASEQFAPTSFARARLLRQAHACGLLSAAEVERAGNVLDLAQ